MSGPRYSLRLAPLPAGNMGDWQGRHLAAIAAPRGPEVPIVDLIQAWAGYANRHREEYDCGIGDDGVLGPRWAAIGRELRGLLDGSMGRLDAGQLGAFLSDTLTAEGFDPERR